MRMKEQQQKYREKVQTTIFVLFVWSDAQVY